MRLGLFYTIPIADESGSVGRLEHVLISDQKMIESSGSPQQFVMTRIALELAGLVESHGLPPTLWSFEPSEKVRRLCNMPEVLDFSKGVFT